MYGFPKEAKSCKRTKFVFAAVITFWERKRNIMQQVHLQANEIPLKDSRRKKHSKFRVRWKEKVKYSALKRQWIELNHVSFNSFICDSRSSRDDFYFTDLLQTDREHHCFIQMNGLHDFPEKGSLNFLKVSSKNNLISLIKMSNLRISVRPRVILFD